MLTVMTNTPPKGPPAPPAAAFSAGETPMARSTSKLADGHSTLPPTDSPYAMVSASARVKGLRLVIVEDDASRAAALSSALQSLGAVVTVGDRGEQGYEAACNALPDAVISDLATPGQPGWQLLQRIRRHPVLRFTPVLLFRWWEPSAEDRGIVRLTRVLDRLEEMLAPMRVLEDRLAASRPSSERLELTGPGPLLRLVAKARLSGLLTVNDAWSVFEVHVDHGELHSIVRRGLGGGVDTGDVAFLQLLLCEAGRWSWRNLPSMEVAANLKRSLDKAMKDASLLLGAVFSPGRFKLIRDPRHLTVQTDMLADLSATMPLSAQRVIEALLAGLPAQDLQHLFAKNDPQELERSLQSLVRCGAIRLHRLPRMSAVGPAQRHAAETAMALLELSLQGGPVAEKSRGSVIITDSIPPFPLPFIPPDSSDKKATDKAPRDDSSRRLAVSATLLERDTDTPADADDSPYNRPTTPDDLLAPSYRPTAPTSENLSSQEPDSRFPSGMDEKGRATLQMGVGVGLALLLGAAIIAGLMFLASGTRGRNATGSPDRETASADTDTSS